MTARNTVGQGAQAVADDAAESATVAVDGAAPVDAPVVRTEADKPPPPPEAEQIAAADELIARFPPDDVMDEPRKLQALADELAKHDGHPAFAARFVDRFGAKNLLDVPRVLQAWQYNRMDGQQVAHNETTLGFDEVRDRPKPGEVEGILYGFCATLATATTDENLTEDEQRELDDLIVGGDPVALSWLLTDNTHVYDTAFLEKTFRIVEQAIAVGWEPPYGATGPITGRDGKPLSNDPKVGILNAISRNQAAAAAIATGTIGPFDLVVGNERVQVDTITKLLYAGQYGDDGDAAGRVLDAAHRALSGTDAPGARKLVDDIVDHANDGKELQGATQSLRDIGLRAETTAADADAAAQKVQANPNHPARELLLAQASRVKTTADAFVRDAAANKGHTRELLLETRAAWDYVANGLLDPAMAKHAEDALEHTMAAIGDGKSLTNEARRGLALALPTQLDRLADILHDDTEHKDGPGPIDDEGMNASAAQIIETLKEISGDDQAMAHLVTGLGGWASTTFAQLAQSLDDAIAGPEGIANAGLSLDIGQYNDAGMDIMGEMFCQTVHSVNLQGAEAEANAKRLIGRFQFGVNLAFDVVPGLRSIGSIAKIGDHDIPGTIKGPVVDDTIDQVKTGIAEALSGTDPTGLAAATAARTDGVEKSLNAMIMDEMMASIARRPGFLQKAGIPLPEFMFKEPAPSLSETVPFPPGYPEAYLKDDFLTMMSDGEQVIKLPKPGDAAYDTFQAKIDVPDAFDSRLTNLADGLTKETSDRMWKCLDDAMG